MSNESPGGDAGRSGPPAAPDVTVETDDDGASPGSPATPVSLPGADGEGSIRLVGTAHVSSDSVDEVEAAIEGSDPDVVAVELDEGRYRQLRGETPEDLDPADLLRGGMAFQLLAYWLLSYVQQRLGERFDVDPGADMRAAVEAAHDRDLGLALVDRDIQVTVQRFWARLSLREKLRLVWQLALAVVGIGGADDDLEIDEESLTDADVVTAMLEEFRRFSPGGAAALIDERDAYIAYNLVALRERGYDVVAVVGAGHLDGVRGYLDEPGSLPDPSSLTGRASGRISVSTVLGYALTLGFLVFFGLLVMAGVGNQVLLRVFLAWFLFNGVFAAGLALLAGAHPTSALVGGGVAWLTSLNPLLAPGWFAGYVELRRRPVNVADIGTLNDIISDEEAPIRDLLTRMLDVPLFRLVAVVALTNLGSIVASFLFPVVVLPMLGGPFNSVGDLSAALGKGISRSIDLIVGLVV